MDMTIEDTWVNICQVDDIPLLGSRLIERASGTRPLMMIYKLSKPHIGTE